MGKFIITEEFCKIFPEAEIAVITLRGINNSEDAAAPVRQEITDMLESSQKEAKKYLTEEVFIENSVISVWREAFRRFKTKKGARSSIEALLKRIEKGSGIYSINPLVDIYNAVSLTYALPCGGEDMDSFRGDMLLTVAGGGEAFLALGDEDYDNALPGEVIYKDEEGAVCRCWNWRDGQRTMLREETVNAFLIIESVDPERKDDLLAAAGKLAELGVRYLGGEARVSILNNVDRELSL